LPPRNKTLDGSLVAIALSMLLIGDAGAAETSIKLGNTAPYSGPASAYGTIARAEAAYFEMLNDQGGINGRRVDFLTLDDAYSPSKTVEQTRKLVEQDECWRCSARSAPRRISPFRNISMPNTSRRSSFPPGRRGGTIPNSFRGRSVSIRPMNWKAGSTPNTFCKPGRTQKSLSSRPTRTPEKITSADSRQAWASMSISWYRRPPI